MTLVCPECGNGTFEQVRTTRTRFTIQFVGTPDCPNEIDLPDELEDSGERDEDSIRCGDCGEEFDAEASGLITEEQYNREDEEEE